MSKLEGHYVQKILGGKMTPGSIGYLCSIFKSAKDPSGLAGAITTKQSLQQQPLIEELTDLLGFKATLNNPRFKAVKDYHLKMEQTLLALHNRIGELPSFQNYLAVAETTAKIGDPKDQATKNAMITEITCDPEVQSILESAPKEPKSKLMNDFIHETRANGKVLARLHKSPKPDENTLIILDDNNDQTHTPVETTVPGMTL